MWQRLKNEYKSHDLVAEQFVLGHSLLNPEMLITVREFIEAASTLQVFPSCHLAMVALSDRNDAIDATTACAILDTKMT